MSFETFADVTLFREHDSHAPKIVSVNYAKLSGIESSASKGNLSLHMKVPYNKCVWGG